MSSARLLTRLAWNAALALSASALTATAALAAPPAAPAPASSAGAQPHTVTATPPATAPDDEASRATQLDAAVSDARETIRRNILQYPIAPGLTLGELIDRTNDAAGLSRLVHDAQQRGGTRWTACHVCEVRLEVTGADVASAVQKAIDADRAKLPASRQALQAGLSALRSRTFCAVGKSAAPDNLMALRPGAGSTAWRDVSESDRRDAIQSARNNAVTRVLTSLRQTPIDAAGDKTLGDALQVPAISDSIRDWIAGRPVTAIEFGDDLDVRVTLSAPPAELAPVVRSALVRHGLGPAPDDAPAWARVESAIARDAAPAVGRSAASPSRPQCAANGAMPADPPDWVSRQLDADGAAKGSGLKAARVAEADALAGLRRQVDALPLGPRNTLGQAARSDSRLDRQLTTVLARAPVSKVDYAPGAVHVRITLQLQDVWQAISCQN